MFVLEFKVKAKTQQYQAIDDAIRTSQFIRNKCVRLWMDTKGTDKNDLYRYSKELAQDFKFADELIQLLDRQVLNVLGVQLVVFTTTVNARYQAKRGILNLRSLVVRLNRPLA